jgi:nitrogen fixation NifU-like protein
MPLIGAAAADEHLAVALDHSGDNLKRRIHAARIPPIMNTAMYSERLLEHFRNPHNVGVLAPPAVSVEVSNPACGDLLRLSAELHEGVVTRVRYQVKGCTASIAAGSALTDWLAGKSISEAVSLETGTVEDALGGLSPESKHAALLCVDAVRALVRLLQSK